MAEQEVPPVHGIPESHTVPTYDIPKAFFDKHGKPHLANLEEYKKLHKQSIEDPQTFWGDRAHELLSWENDFHRTHSGTLAGGGYYFTGDGAARDCDGYYWIRGRVDDVVNVSGHRLSTAEIEAALIEHAAVGEAAVVGINDELTGQAVNAFVSIKDGHEQSEELRKELILQVRKSIGPFAAPKAVFCIPDLPKTRSGKIMRRILRKILAGEEDQLGDTSTLSDPSVVDKIIETVKAGRK